MKKMLFALATGGLLLSTTAISASKDSSIEMRAVGEPADCVSLRSIRSTKIIDDSTIDFKMIGGKTLRNKLPYSCPSLKSEDSFSYKTSLSQLCSVDTIRVLQNYGGSLHEGAACGLGKFQPVEPATTG